MTLTLSPPAALAITANPLLVPARSVGAIETELSRRPHLQADQRLSRHEIKARLIDARQAKCAVEAIGQLPGESESIHLAISGRFALWDFVPAALELAGCRIDRLTIATLGFSNRNVAKMCDMVDAGDIGHVRLLCSHYFAGTSAPIYDTAVEEFAKRPDRMEFLSIRTHAKILLLAFEDGRRLTMESSANLRSCKNIEQASAFGDPVVYAFHAGWIDPLFTAARA